MESAAVYRLLPRLSSPPLQLHRCTASASASASASSLFRLSCDPSRAASATTRTCSLLRSSRDGKVGRITQPLAFSTTRMLSAQSQNPSTSPEVQAVTVEIVQELLNKGHRYLDVRTVEEFATGHIQGAVNVPYMNKGGSGMVKNPSFVEEVRKKFNPEDEIIVGCQAGVRSRMATSDLAAGGFTGLTDMLGGFGAWLQSGQPITK